MDSLNKLDNQNGENHFQSLDKYQLEMFNKYIIMLKMMHYQQCMLY